MDFKYKPSTFKVDKQSNTITCIKGYNNNPNHSSTSFGSFINATSTATFTLKIKFNNIIKRGLPMYVGIIGEDHNVNKHIQSGHKGYTLQTSTGNFFGWSKTFPGKSKFTTGDVLCLILDMNELSLSYSKNNGKISFVCTKGTVKRVKYKWGISMYTKGDSATIISISSSESTSPPEEKNDGLLTQINELKIQNAKLQNDILKAVENTSRLQSENEQIGSKMKNLVADIVQLRNEKSQTRKMM
eukprot:730989_1